MTRQLTFLVVEDNDLDFEKVQRAFGKMKVTNPIVRAKDGFEALKLLRGSASAEKLMKPYVILLDVNMPKMNGFEFLQELRAEPDLSDTTVVVLTTSDRRSDVETAYRFHVAGFIVKPVTRDEMVSALGTLDAYWHLCEYPEGT